MSVKVLIPTVLQSHTNESTVVEIEAANVGEVFQKLTEDFPGIKEHIMTGDDELRSFINVFVNEDDIRSNGNMAASVKDGDEVSIVPSIAGGAQVEKDKVMDALYECYDPEIPVNIVDLGLIYDVIITEAESDPEKSKVHVNMTLTAPGCPEAPKMQADTQQKVSEVPGVAEAKVEIVWEPVWTPDRMTDAAKLELGMS